MATGHDDDDDDDDDDDADDAHVDDDDDHLRVACYPRAPVSHVTLGRPCHMLPWVEQQVLRVFTLAAETIDSDAQVFATLLFAAVPRGRAMAPGPCRRAGKRPRTCHHLQLVMGHVS